MTVAGSREKHNDLEDKGILMKRAFRWDWSKQEWNYVPPPRHWRRAKLESDEY